MAVTVLPYKTVPGPLGWEFYKQKQWWPIMQTNISRKNQIFTFA